MASSSKAPDAMDVDAQVIVPQSHVPTLDTSNWPLLLKNYHKCTFLKLQVGTFQFVECRNVGS